MPDTSEVSNIDPNIGPEDTTIINGKLGGNNKQGEIVQPENPDVDFDWTEQRNDIERKYDQIITDTVHFARDTFEYGTDNFQQKLDALFPLPPKPNDLSNNDSPEVKEYNKVLKKRQEFEDALKECLFIDDPKSNASETNDNPQYDPPSGEFTNTNVEQDNVQRHQKVIIDTLNQAKSQGVIKEDLPFGQSFMDRLDSTKVILPSGEYEGYKVDMREVGVGEETRLIEESTGIFNQLRLKARSEGMFEDKQRVQYAVTTLTEFVALLNRQGAPKGVQLQLTHEALQTLLRNGSDFLDGVGFSLKDKDNHEQRVSARDLTRSLKIRFAEIREGEEGINPFADWITQEVITSGGVTKDGNKLGEKDADSFKKALFGEDLDGMALDAMGKLEYFANADSKLADSFLGKFARRIDFDLSQIFNNSELKGYKISTGTTKELVRKVFGNAEGLTIQHLASLDRQYGTDMYKDYDKLKHLDLKGINWENWGMGMIFTYSLFGPMMSEGEEEDRGN